MFVVAYDKTGTRNDPGDRLVTSDQEEAHESEPSTFSSPHDDFDFGQGVTEWKHVRGARVENKGRTGMAGEYKPCDSRAIWIGSADNRDRAIWIGSADNRKLDGNPANSTQDGRQAFNTVGIDDGHVRGWLAVGLQKGDQVGLPFPEQRDYLGQHG